MTQTGHAGKVYELTGPEALSLIDIAQVLTEAWGQPITAVDMEPNAFGTMLVARGVLPFAVNAIVRLRQASAVGEYATETDDARRLAGRAVETMRAYVRRF